MKIETIPYDFYVVEAEKMLKSYNQVVDWLNSIGFIYSRTRFGGYKKIIESFLSELKEISVTEFESRLHEYLNAHSELVEITRIYNDVSTYQELSYYTDQMKKVMSGQPFRNHSAKDQSRDYAFELTMAARFIRGGYKAELNQLADIVVTKDNSPKIYVECKRIKSIKKISANVGAANEQLKKRLSLDNSSKSKGLVAINVNDILNPNNNMLAMKNASTLQKFNSDQLDDFVIKHMAQFESKKFNKSLGVFCEYISQGFIYDTAPAICNCRGVKLYQYKSRGVDEETLNKLANSLSNQNVFT